MNGIRQSKKELMLCGVRKIVLQVVAQTEASNENNKVGIARNEPNRSAAEALLSVMFWA